MVLKRFVHGADGEAFFQKRAPDKRPDWMRDVTLSFPSGRTAEEIVVSDAAQLAWVVNLGCIDLNPHPVRADDLDHPDELRVDLDPVPGIGWPQILAGRAGRQGRAGRLRADRLAEDLGLARLPHLRPDRAALGLHRGPPRRRRAGQGDRAARPRPGHRANGGRRSGTASSSTTTRTPRTGRSPRRTRSGPTRDARVSTPLAWSEVPGCDPEAFTIDTVPERFARIGDPWQDMDGAAGSLEPLLALADRARGGRPRRRALAAALRQAGR